MLKFRGQNGEAMASKNWSDGTMKLPMNGNREGAPRKRMHFVFFGVKRSWPAFQGHKPPADTLVELRSLPGNVVAAGATFEEADERLKLTLEAHFRRAGSPRKWYEAALDAMTDEDVNDFKELLLTAVTKDKFEDAGTPEASYERALLDEAALAVA